MIGFIKLDRMLLRLDFVLLLILGLYIWISGNATIVPAHMGLGFLFVLMLWGMAVAGSRTGAGGGLVTLAVVWGLLLLVVGLGQRSAMVGHLHWIVRVVHLLVGIIAMPIAERIAAKSLSHAAGSEAGA